MWLLLGLLSIITAILNIYAWNKGKDASYYRFASVSLTALTVCAFYSDGAKRVAAESWGTLMDVMPSTAPMLWTCVIISIIINGISLFKKDKKDY